MSDANLADKTADSTCLDESTNLNNDEDVSMNDTTQPLELSIDIEKQAEQKQMSRRRSLRNSKEDDCECLDPILKPSPKVSNKNDKNLRISMKLENEKKRLELKEKKEKELKEKEEKRLKREEEIRKKKEETQKRLEEARVKREKEKEERERLNQEKLEKERKRQEQINAKNEEKKRQEEEKRKVDEEKQKEVEEKRRKEEKIKNQFASYFIKKDPPLNERSSEDQKMYRFMPFQLKENMSVAPICRREDFVQMGSEQREEFIKNMDSLILDSEQSENLANYLKQIKVSSRKNIMKCRRKFVELQDEESNLSSNDVKIIGNENLVISARTKFKVKYLHFDLKVHRRPPYYGTWRKRSSTIKPTKPFAKDKSIDYEVDSDDEWEDEPDGESITDSEKGDPEEDTLNDENDDDGFFVPHGHLSDDEVDEDERMLDPDTKKAREEAKVEQWETERKRSSRMLLPKCYFLNDYWKYTETDLANSFISDIKHLVKFKMVPLGSLPVVCVNEIILQQQAQKEKEEQKLNKANKSNANPESSASKSKNKKEKNLSAVSVKNSPQPNPQPAAVPAPTPVAPSTPTTGSSIIKFISKMSKKNVSLCKIETAESSKSSSLEKSPAVTNKQLMSPLNTKMNASKLLHTPNSSAHPNSATTPSTPLSPRMASNTNCGTGEKRACNENAETAVKRLKLDDNSSNDNSKSAKTSPTISSLFKMASCKKNLKLAALGSPAATEKKHITLQTVKESTTAETSDEKKAESGEKMEVDQVKQNNKENQKKVFITLD